VAARGKDLRGSSESIRGTDQEEGTSNLDPSASRPLEKSGCAGGPDQGFRRFHAARSRDPDDARVGCHVAGRAAYRSGNTMEGEARGAWRVAVRRENLREAGRRGSGWWELKKGKGRRVAD
jgi:hypothetical protein